MRNVWVLIHRYVGLVMAGFLVIAGLSGSLLVWYHELDSWINDEQMHVEPPAPGAAPLPALALRERILAQYPGAAMNYVSLHADDATHAVQYYIEAAPGAAVAFDFDELFVDPYTGTVLGTRTWGDISEGMTNLMPFIYRLHYSLALDTIGTYAFGIIAALWTLDCFVGAYLTFPRRRRSRHRVVARRTSQAWLQRWWPAWQVRWRGGVYKLNFDLHVAGGLWPWALLFVFAWSSVAFNLYGEVYRPVTAAVFDMQESAYDRPDIADPRPEPALGWQGGMAQARLRMAELAAEKGFTVEYEEAISYEPEKNFFRYKARTDRDVGDRGGQTVIYVDATTGERVGSYIPTGEAAGDTITSWLLDLHMAQVWGMPFRIVVTLIGVVVAMLSVTGVVIWLRKRRARRASDLRKAQSAALDYA